VTAANRGPVLFAYDGSDLAKLAIDEAGRQLSPGREALVLTVWRPFAVGFVPVRDLPFDAAASNEVRDAAIQTAAQGASLAQAAGFLAQSTAVDDAPTWKAISHFADEHDASLIVLGSHGKSGLAGAFLGSVAASVAGHSQRSVLIVHRHA
jgi:nucleotide-binding universal stress UspA family protein